MATTLTTKFQNDITRLVYEDIQNNKFYFMISSVAKTALARVDAENTLYSKNEFKENILFGKQIFQEDIKYMIKYYPWQKDAIYTQYDDQEDMADKNFYAVVGPTNNDSGDYRVYKCLSNNNGAPSTTPPSYDPTIADQIYRTTDGYVWKFMYYLTEPHFEAYNASGYIPLSGTFETNPDPAADANNVITGSEVSDIFVINNIDNVGYPSLENGQVTGPPGNDGTIKIKANNISVRDNYYADMTIYASNNDTGESFVYVIESYTWDSTSNNEGTLKVVGTPQADGLKINASFKIVPTVKISGDGEGATAIPRVVDGKITNIEVLDPGKNYNNILAEIVDPPFDFYPDDDNSIDVRARLRPILSPTGYHNWNLIDEMHCRHILLYAYITETDNNQIGKTNTYSALGVVKNPVFTPDPDTANTAPPLIFDNRLAIVTDDYGKVEQNSQLFQRNANNDITFSAYVHEVDSDNKTLYLSSYMGPYANQANNDISLDANTFLTNSTGQQITINTPIASNVIESRYTQRSGTVYFMEDFFPLERTENSREEYKLVLEF
jgi:hypothetical protein